MTGTQAIPVVACVAAVLAAYNDSSKLFHAMKKKRHRRGQNAEKSLSSSLELGRIEILARWNMNAAQLGKRYEEGDTASQEQIEEIMVKIQGKLLSPLRASVQKNVNLDISAALLASDLGRARTIFVLQELYHRIAVTVSAPLPVSKDSIRVNPSSTMACYMRYYEEQGYLAHPSSNGWSLPPGPPALRVLRGALPPPNGIAELDNEPASTHPEQRTPALVHPSSPLSKIHSLNGSKSSINSATASPGPPPYESLLQIPDGSDIPYKRYRQQTFGLDITRGLRDLQIDPRKDEKRSDPSRILGYDAKLPREAVGQRRGNLPVHPAVRENVPPSRDPAAPNTSHTSLAWNKIGPPIHSKLSLARTVSPMVYNKPYWPPRRENKYAGFCKGAWKLSFGTGRLLYNSEPYGFYGYRQRWCCPCCFFSSPPAPPVPKKEARVDRTVYVHPGTGIKYRWIFLAKSHMAKKEGLSQRSSGFGCIFCVAELGVPAPISDSVEDFMQHLASHWRVDAGGMLAELTRLVVGRVAHDDEDFEINIVAL
ncbi:hypothetical protein N7468_006893 [Penicillium chermesinum]|uniref:Uncharacterized protein n=1 Tax=Penicillium chermesinum TaxID=63820 RepID=A0A9W9NVG9_9EURO|nr:uncharacterized protein N7468_006893 [Penicillium chermesinum]KAJ5225668.1 hypothetical protein N7468_006893 [Penicillium chermesinum]KAJ6161114.1 hypothetical protein N7470_004510 [Penicillium chermesinum]